MLRSNQLSYIAEARNYSQIFEAFRAAGDAGAGPRRSAGATGSVVLEHRLALVHESVHAFFLILGGEHRVEQAALEHHAI